MGTGKQRIRLVACDIDGTLIGPGGHGIDVARQALIFAANAESGLQRQPEGPLALQKSTLRPWA